MPRRNLTALLLLLVAVGLQATACGYSAPAEGEGDEPAKVEPVEDSDLSKVVLTEDAAKRIGLETAPVAASNVESDVVVRGRVAADPAASGSLLVRVSMPAAELAKVDVSKAARVLAVFGSDGVVAPLVGGAASAGALTYRLDGAGQVVHAGQRVRVKVPLSARRRAEDDPVLRGHLRRRGRRLGIHQRRAAHVRSRAHHRGVGSGRHSGSQRGAAPGHRGRHGRRRGAPRHGIRDRGRVIVLLPMSSREVLRP